MSDAFFNKVFGDSEPTRVGSGWVSGVLGVFSGLLGLGGALCLHFPALLTLPDARAHYPIGIMRLRHPRFLRTSHDPTEFDFGFMTVRVMKSLGLVKASRTGGDMPPDLALKEIGF